MKREWGRGSPDVCGIFPSPSTATEVVEGREVYPESVEGSPSTATDETFPRQYIA